MTNAAMEPAASAPGRYGRRGLLAAGAAGLGVGALEWGPWPGAGVARASADEGGLDFVVLTDTHANDEQTTRLLNLQRVFAAIERDRPQFVLHCGDISDYGSAKEFEAYRRQIPDSLWDRIRHVPGNHEARWDETAGERYRSLFGPSSYSFDRSGVHFVALDPTQALQEPGLFGEDLTNFRQDLARAGDRPSILFLHYPLGGRNYFVNDTDDLLELVERHPVRGIFAGHIHRNEVTRFNGITQVAAVATLNGPMYLRVREHRVGRTRSLRVDQVTLGDGDEESLTRLADIPLSDGTDTIDAPTVGLDEASDQVALRVRAGGDATAVAAQVYPQGLFGGTSDGEWVALDKRGPSWRGAIDVADLPPGRHRIQVRAVDAAGSVGERSIPFSRQGTAASSIAWEIPFGGQLQGALAAHRDVFAVTSTSGRVALYRSATEHPRELWHTSIGPVHRGPAFSADGEVIYVASADHRLHALDTASGRARWRADLGLPVLSSPLVGSEHIFVSAGDRLFCLDGTGRVRWRTEIGYLSAGRPASDGQRIYLGAGDGRGYAYDARTGEELWSVLTNTKTDAYTRLLYGPWDDTVELLPGGLVLFSTVSQAIAVDTATGQERWRKDGSYVYTPSLRLGDRLLMITERGVAGLVDIDSGLEQWSVQTAPRVFNAGPVLDSRTGLVWVLGTAGLLVSVDVGAGSASFERQLFTANTFSTPVLVGDRLVVGAQDGVLRGIDLGRDLSR